MELILVVGLFLCVSCLYLIDKLIGYYEET